MRATAATIHAVNSLTSRWAAASPELGAGAPHTTPAPPAQGTEAARTAAASAEPGAAAPHTTPASPGPGTKAPRTALPSPARPTGTVLSGACVWPLLALLGGAATGRARTELADATGIPPAEAATRARELLGLLGTAPGLRAAVGLWTVRTLGLRDSWLRGLPDHTHGVLTGDPDRDAAALDAWAARRTDGEITTLPVQPKPDTELVLAAALTLRTEWLRPFEEGPLCPESGPWRELTVRGLTRTTTLLDRLAVADTPVGALTRLRVLGTNGIDVQLLLGEPDADPAGVLSAGVDLLTRRDALITGDRLPFGRPGPGITVERVRTERPMPPELRVSTAAFTVDATHDLAGLPEVFGLGAALDERRGHFPGMSGRPLSISAAAQTATATFGPLGFRAAAVTAFSGVAGGVPRTRYLSTEVQADFDRPFGFLAVHRATRLVLAAGWVGDPEPFHEDEEEYGTGRGDGRTVTGRSAGR